MGIYPSCKMKLATGLMLLAFLCAAAIVLSSAEEPSVYPLNDAKDDSPVSVESSDSKTLAESAQQVQEEQADKEQEKEHAKEENAEPDESYGGAYKHTWHSMTGDNYGAERYDQKHKPFDHAEIAPPDGMP